MVSEQAEEESLIDGESLWDLRTNPWDPPSERMVTLMHRLSYYFKRGEKRYRDYYDFDIEGKPPKYIRQDIYKIFDDIYYELRITREWFYQYLAVHTNLTANHKPSAIKKGFQKCYGNGKGNSAGTLWEQK